MHIPSHSNRKLTSPVKVSAHPFPGTPDELLRVRNLTTNAYNDINTDFKNIALARQMCNHQIKILFPAACPALTPSSSGFYKRQASINNHS